MIQSYIQSPIVTLLTNDSPVASQEDDVRTNSAKNCNSCSWLCHNEGNPLYKINKGGLYHVTLTANVSSTTAGVVALGLYLDGVLLPGGSAVITLAAAGDYANIAINKEVYICHSGILTIQAIPTVVTPTDPTTPITTEVPIIVGANLRIERDC